MYALVIAIGQEIGQRQGGKDAKGQATGQYAPRGRITCELTFHRLWNEKISRDPLKKPKKVSRMPHLAMYLWHCWTRVIWELVYSSLCRPSTREPSTSHMPRVSNVRSHTKDYKTRRWKTRSSWVCSGSGWTWHPCSPWHEAVYTNMVVWTKAHCLTECSILFNGNYCLHYMKTEDLSQWFHHTYTVTKENLATTTMDKEAILWHHTMLADTQKVIREHGVWLVKFINLGEWHKYTIHLCHAHTLCVPSGIIKWNKDPSMLEHHLVTNSPLANIEDTNDVKISQVLLMITVMGPTKCKVHIQSLCVQLTTSLLLYKILKDKGLMLEVYSNEALVSQMNAMMQTLFSWGCASNTGSINPQASDEAPTPSADFGGPMEGTSIATVHIWVINSQMLGDISLMNMVPEPRSSAEGSLGPPLPIKHIPCTHHASPTEYMHAGHLHGIHPTMHHWWVICLLSPPTTHNNSQQLLVYHQKKVSHIPTSVVT
jgi:hypothetical protein